MILTTIFIDKKGKAHKTIGVSKIKYSNEDWTPMLIPGKGRFKLHDNSIEERLKKEHK